MTTAVTVTLDAPEWLGIAAENAQAISDGETAMQVQRRGIDRIFAIGRAFEILQSEAMRRSHSNNPIGKRYNEAYAAMTKPAPELTKVNKTDRNQYIWCWQHHNEVAAWWGTVAQNQRDRWGHPDAVKRHYLSAHGSDGTTTTKPGGTDAPKETLKQANVRLQEENDALHKRLKRAADTITEGTDWTWQDTPADIAAVLYRLQPTKAKLVASKILQLAKSTEPSPKRVKKEG